MKEPKKVKVLQYQPHQVTVRYFPNGPTVNLSKTFFEKRWNMGLLRALNPEALPLAL